MPACDHQSITPIHSMPNRAMCDDCDVLFIHADDGGERMTKSEKTEHGLEEIIHREVAKFYAVPDNSPDLVKRQVRVQMEDARDACRAAVVAAFKEATLDYTVADLQRLRDFTRVARALAAQGTGGEAK